MVTHEPFSNEFSSNGTLYNLQHFIPVRHIHLNTVEEGDEEEEMKCHSIHTSTLSSPGCS